MTDRDYQDYLEFLRFPTVGADPRHLADCENCILWLTNWLKNLGFICQPLREGDQPPVLYAELPGKGKAVLFYGHYDVQPADPLELWNTPPFEPTERDGRIYARGAEDDKGQVFAFLCGLRGFIAANPEHPTIKILLDGQEESGSIALDALVPKIADRIHADVLLVSDTMAAGGLRPAVVAGLRGVVHYTVTLEGANRDLHSGRYGGTAPNAAQAMCELLASLHHADGSIAVEGFENGLLPPSAEELRLAEESFPSAEDFERDVGVPPVGGERALPMVVRNSFRATIEVNGVHSGYGGPGSKTVIPCKAIAKLSMRYAPGMNPHQAMEAVTRHFKSHLPPGMKLSIDEVTGHIPGFRLPLDSQLFAMAREVLSEIDPRGAVFQWDGASILIVAKLVEYSGAEPLLVGFGQDEDCIHSPNESFSRAQFDFGLQWAYRILSRLI